MTVSYLQALAAAGMLDHPERVQHVEVHRFLYEQRFIVEVNGEQVYDGPDECRACVIAARARRR